MDIVDRYTAAVPVISRLSSQVHSKLRNGGAKGRASRLSSTTASATPSTPTSSNSSSNGTNSATAGLPTLAPSASVLNSIANMAKQAQLEAKRKMSSDDAGSNSNDGLPSGASGATVVNPVTGLNVQILPKKSKTTSPCAISPVLLECPEQFCSKKYKHANGLRYHQSHAHGGGSGMLAGNDDDSSQPPIESPKQLEAATVTAADPLNENNRSSSPTSSRGAPVEVGGKEDKKSEVTPMDTMDSRSNSSSLNLSATTTTTTGAGGVLRFGPSGSTEEADDATMDSQKSATGGDGGRNSKKGRKSPGPSQDGATGNTSQLLGTLSAGPQLNRAEDVKSPAYSDISDDSTPVAESEANRKCAFGLIDRFVISGGIVVTGGVRKIP